MESGILCVGDLLECLPQWSNAMLFVRCRHAAANCSGAAFGLNQHTGNFTD